MQSELYKITNFVYFAVAACGLLFGKVRTAFIVPELCSAALCALPPMSGRAGGGLTFFRLRSGCLIGGACRGAAT